MIKAKRLRGIETRVRARRKSPPQRPRTAKDKEAAAKAKEAEAKTKEADPKAKDAPTSQPSQKEDLLAPKAKA